MLAHTPRPQTSQGTEAVGGLFLCDFPGCGKSYASADYLKKHTKTHTDPLKYKCTWTGCNFATNKHNKLYLHECRHKGILPYPCPKAECDKRFITPNRRDKHALSHSVSRLYLCGHPNCQARFDKWSQLQSHLAKDHIPTCSKCQKTFTTNNKLKLHFRTHLADDSELTQGTFLLRSKCPYEGCSSSFRQKNNLTHHIRTIHQGLESQRCPVESCERVFLSKGRLQAHLKRNHPANPLYNPPDPKPKNPTTPARPPSIDPDLAIVNAILGRKEPKNLAAPFPCPIPTCDARYTLLAMLEKHLSNVHSVDVPAPPGNPSF
ncbi:hypothetical protein L0F63_002921 [Massospora cicadina]|nr:hypothetical protein L0F63_002921 [Massospora cicadina]